VSCFIRFVPVCLKKAGRSDLTLKTNDKSTKALSFIKNERDFYLNNSVKQLAKFIYEMICCLTNSSTEAAVYFIAEKSLINSSGINPLFSIFPSPLFSMIL